MQAIEPSEVDDLYGAMEAIDMDFPSPKEKAKEKLSLEQKEMIQQLRERVRPLLKPDQQEDNYLVKWLIARNFDLDQAEEMLRKHIRFVKLNKLDDIENYEPPEATQYFHTAFLGYDKEGSLVRVLNIGRSDIKSLCNALSKADCIKWACFVLKSDTKMQKQDRANDTICDKHVYIIDLEGLSWSAVVTRIVINRALTLLKNYESNFPERLKVAYIVNAPNFFSFVYNWLKSILPESIISKLDIVSQDQYRSKLGEFIDLSILPYVYGGTRTNSDDPYCQSLYAKPVGTPFPENLLSTENMENLKNDPDAKKITVEYKSLFIVEKEVVEPNSVLQWDFQTLNYDIRMGLRYKPDENSNPEEIIPPHRIDSHLFPESGSFMCENSGIYELVFDNTYSWMTSKELIFKVKLQLPSERTESDE